MEQKILLQDESGDKDFFTIIPNYILNHSTSADQALYLQLKRLAGDGKKNYCYPSFGYLSKQTGLGKKAIKTSLNYLISHKWIDSLGKRRIMTAGGMQWVNAYKINNIWSLNNDYYKGGSESTPLAKGGPEVSKGGLKDTKGGPEGACKEERKKERIKEQVCFQLKDWNERQPSPITNFVPENIVNKYGAAKIEAMIKEWGQENHGFNRFLANLKDL